MGLLHFGLTMVNPTTGSIVLVALFSLYVMYQRYWHPLARFPGPFMASVTDVWEFRQWFTRKWPYRLTDLHAKYGPVVRYGPNKISVTTPDAVRTLFVKGNRTVAKTEFYNAFGEPGNPNLFNQRDSTAHAIRRRTLLKSFSPQAIASYEPLINKHLQVMRSRIRQKCATGQTFDLKQYAYEFICDVIISLMWGMDLDIQKTGEVEHLPGDHDVSAWGAAAGSWPLMQSVLSLVVLLLPHPRDPKRRSTFDYIRTCTNSVKSRYDAINKGFNLDRKDVLTRMIQNSADGPVKMNTNHLQAEAFGLAIAGVQPPSATLNLLLYNLLHYPKIKQCMVAEIDRSMPSIGPNDEPYSITAVETGLPYLRNCVKENFRLNPTFAMPLARQVLADQGIVVNNQVIPKGTSIALCNYAFQHNADVWGEDHDVYDPSRWEGESSISLGRLLMHFGAGSRQCIGKTLAMALIHKVTATIFSEFDIELADNEEQVEAELGLFSGKLPPQVNFGISDLEGPLMVRTKLRTAR